MIDKEVNELLSKWAINLVDQKAKFLSRLPLVPKKNEEEIPVINLKELNEFIP